MYKDAYLGNVFRLEWHLASCAMTRGDAASSIGDIGCGTTAIAGCHLLRSEACKKAIKIVEVGEYGGAGHEAGARTRSSEGNRRQFVDKRVPYSATSYG